MKGEHALHEVSHALMRKHCPYHPGAHLSHCQVHGGDLTTKAATRAHAEPLKSYPVTRDVSGFLVMTNSEMALGPPCSLQVSGTFFKMISKVRECVTTSVHLQVSGSFV